MDEIKVQEKNTLLKIALFLFIIFLILYICKETGFYEYKAHNKSVLTSESLKKFENDVNEGKDVSLKDYVVDEHIDYSNKVSNLGYNNSNNVISGLEIGTDISNIISNIRNKYNLSLCFIWLF